MRITMVVNLGVAVYDSVQLVNIIPMTMVFDACNELCIYVVFMEFVNQLISSGLTL